MERYLVDTNVVVDNVRGVERAQKFIKKHLPSVSQVSIAELIEGVKNKSHLRAINAVIADLEIIPINASKATQAIELMQQFFLSHNLKFLDALIAAAAMEENLTLVTSNTKHFSFIKGLKLLDWSQARQ